MRTTTNKLGVFSTQEMKRLISAIVALFLILFGTVGCNEEMQVPEEPTAMVSPAELLKELRRDFRKENDALAFHLRIHNGNFNSQDLIRSYLSEHFGYSSSALNAYEKALVRVPNLTFRSDSEQQFFTNAALAKIDFYVNSAENFDHPQDYISFLDQEFASHLSADLSDETNLGLALWLAIQSESVEFIIRNLDLILNSNGASNARTDGWGWISDKWNSAMEWWDKNGKCVGKSISKTLDKSLDYCIKIGAIAAIGSGGTLTIKGCVVGAATGAVAGVIDSWVEWDC